MIICLYTVKWSQVLLFNISNFIYPVFLFNWNNLHTAVRFQLTRILSIWLNSSIWLINETFTGTPTSSQSGPRSNGNEKVLHISQSVKSRTSPSGDLVSYPGHSLVGGGLTPLCKGAVNVFYSPSRLGGKVRVRNE